MLASVLPLELTLWFKHYGRDLPWRKDPHPWAVIVSEIMLQQTQVSTVLAYFERWMKRFPTPLDLAQASEEEVLKLWEGLGYYRRARALHQAAKYISAQQNIIPSSEEDLLKIPGIGPYTAAAIAAFAFHKRAAPVDGNVARVISRYLGYREDITKAASLHFLRQATLSLLPTQSPWVAAEALIELGARICKPKNPDCASCPLNKSCFAKLHGCQNSLPVKALKPATEPIWRRLALIQHDRFDPLRLESHPLWLVRKKVSAGAFQGLWQFPYRELSDPQSGPLIDLQLEIDHWQTDLKLRLNFKKQLQSLKHSFTRYQVTLWPIWLESQCQIDIQTCSDWTYQWVDMKQLKGLTFCSGHRTLANQLEKMND